MADENMRKEQVTPLGNESENASQTVPNQTVPNRPEVSETWAEETIADLDDFIESQGIYIRQ